MLQCCYFCSKTDDEPTTSHRPRGSCSKSPFHMQRYVNSQFMKEHYLTFMCESFIQYLMSTYCLPGADAGDTDTATHKATTRMPTFQYETGKHIKC